MRPIEEWICDNLGVEWTDSATLRYDGMEHQLPSDLGGVHRPYTPDRIDDWIDLSFVLSYLTALGTTGRILDIGTGDGWPSLPLAPFVQEMIGIDQAKSRIDTAKENLARLGYRNVTFLVASGEALPFPDRAFDGVVAGTAIEQMPSPEGCLNEIHRVLREGGSLVATFENLEGELKGSVEETVELFREEDLVSYRYTVKELDPPREAEYLIILTPNPELEKLAAAFPRRLGFVRRRGEPGERPLTEEIAEVYGLPLLERFSGSIERARGFKLRHFTQSSLRRALSKAGFPEVKVRGPITRIASRFFIALHEEGALEKLSPEFLQICRGLSHAWEEVPPGGSSILFVRARKDDRCHTR